MTTTVTVSEDVMDVIRTYGRVKMNWSQAYIQPTPPPLNVLF